jgi:dTDP-4-dehydrorhamnose reductase
VKILLLGSNGQLGRSFVDDGRLTAFGVLCLGNRAGLSANGKRCEIADLSRPGSLISVLDAIEPDVIINTAAYTAVDRAETEQSLANTVNGEAVKVIGKWAAEHAAKVIHYSTDYVFDGHQSTPYSTSAQTAPLSAYGRSKLLGELALRDSGADYLILRTSWVYAAHGNNFLRTMLRLGSERSEIRVVSDQHGTPTDTTLIVRATLAALERWLQKDSSVTSGTYHVVASGTTTWHGFADAIFDLAKIRGFFKQKPIILPIETKDFPTAAARPAWSLLDNSAFVHRFGFDLPCWQDGLVRVMDQIATKGKFSLC